MRETDRLARILRHALLVLGVLVILMFADEHFGPFGWLVPLDNTDAPGERSGLTVRTDALTGCQYLSRRGAITPRLDSAGKPICGPKK